MIPNQAKQLDKNWNALRQNPNLTLSPCDLGNVVDLHEELMLFAMKLHICMTLDAWMCQGLETLRRSGRK
jgi:hypothetical protein